jgi:hypothetical protein
MIMPPTSTKGSYFNNTLVRALWRQAYDSLRSARRIIAIGYSFPAEDLAAVAMIRRALAADGQLVIVNPDRQLPGHVARLFGRPPTSIYDTTSCVEDFVTEWLEA